jgi:hypothetical protein
MARERPNGVVFQKRQANLVLCYYYHITSIDHEGRGELGIDDRFRAVVFSIGAGFR